MPFNVKDAALQASLTLPNGANTTYSATIDLKKGSLAHNPPAELLLEAPALATGIHADGATVKYSFEHDTASGYGTVVTGHADFLTQTGAGGAGAAAATARIPLPTNCGQYVRIKCVKSGSGNASALTATVSLLT